MVTIHEMKLYLVLSAVKKVEKRCSKDSSTALHQKCLNCVSSMTHLVFNVQLKIVPSFVHPKKCYFLKKMFFCRFVPFGYLYFLIFSMIVPELGARIDPGMALTLTTSI